MLYKVVLTFESLDHGMKPNGVAIQMKATEQHFPVVQPRSQGSLLPVPTERERETLSTGRRENLGTRLSCDTVIMLYKVVLTFQSVDEILCCVHFLPG